MEGINGRNGTGSPSSTVWLTESTSCRVALTCRRSTPVLLMQCLVASPVFRRPSRSAARGRSFRGLTDRTHEGRPPDTAAAHSTLQSVRPMWGRRCRMPPMAGDLAVLSGCAWASVGLTVAGLLQFGMRCLASSCRTLPTQARLWRCAGSSSSHQAIKMAPAEPSEGAELRRGWLGLARWPRVSERPTGWCRRLGSQESPRPSPWRLAAVGVQAWAVWLPPSAAG